MLLTDLTKLGSFGILSNRSNGTAFRFRSGVNDFRNMLSVKFAATVQGSILLSAVLTGPVSWFYAWKKLLYCWEAPPLLTSENSGIPEKEEGSYWSSPGRTGCFPFCFRWAPSSRKNDDENNGWWRIALFLLTWNWFNNFIARSQSIQLKPFLVTSDFPIRLSISRKMKEG